MADKKTPVVTVKGAGDDNKVVLWERHPDHPTGEIFVSNDGKPRQVALTKEVKRRLQAGHLVGVDDEDSEFKPAKKKTKADADPNKPPADPIANPGGNQPPAA